MQLLQKQWDWQQYRSNNMWHGKHGHQDGKPKHVVKIMGDQEVHGWTSAAFLQEMAGLEGQDMFDTVEETFPCSRCIRQETVEAPRLWFEMAMQIFWNVWPEGRKMGLHIDGRQRGKHPFCSFM